MSRLSLLLLLAASAAFSQTVADLAAGKAQFETRCGGCHGGDGKGGARAPDIVTPGMIPERTADELRELITTGVRYAGVVRSRARDEPVDGVLPLDHGIGDA